MALQHVSRPFPPRLRGADTAAPSRIVTASPAHRKQRVREMQFDRRLDGQARRLLNMRGETFKARYEAGLLDREDSNVTRVSLLIPYARRHR